MGVLEPGTVDLRKDSKAGETVARAGAPVDIAPLLDTGRWTPYQKFLTALSALAIIFDGFDIQILGFAIPSMMSEWGEGRPAFGPALAIGLVGMAVGSALAGYWGDRAGRRPALIGCLVLFGAATLATAFVSSVWALTILRFFTGVGTGGAIPNVSALVAEFAPIGRRPMAVKLTLVCVPLGGMLGGLIASSILPTLGWRALYHIGGVAPLGFAALLWFFLPESPRVLAQNSRNWPTLEGVLRRMGRPVPAGCTFVDTGERALHGAPIRILFGATLARDTSGLWVAFFFWLGSVFLVFGWLPAMLTSQGLGVAAASRALAAYNLGGVVGVFVWAALVTTLGSRGPLLGGALAGVGSAVALLFIPLHPGGSNTLMLAVIAVNGLLANAVQTSLYALAAHVYPTSVRASGIAYAAAIGRVGGVLSSICGAAIIGIGPGAYWATVAGSMVIAFAAIAWVRGHFHASRY